MQAKHKIELTIRLAECRDLETVALLLQKLEKEEGNPFGQACRLPAYFHKEAALRLGDSLGRVWLAFEGERPVGQIIVRVEDWREGFAGFFFVEPDAPLNTAYLLLRAATTWFTLKECETVHISTGPKNHTRKAYKRMGFIPTQQIHSAKINSIRSGLHMAEMEPLPRVPMFK